MDILKIAFSWMLFSSFSASIMALLIVLVRLVFKNRIHSRIYSVLWLLVVIRLIFAPFAPESQVSLFNLFSNTNQPSYEQKLQPGMSPIFNLVEWSKASNNHKLSGDMFSTQPEPTDTKVHQGTDLDATVTREDMDSYQVDLFLVFALAWIAGLIILTFAFLRSGIIFTRKLKDAQKIPEFMLPVAVTRNRQGLGIHGEFEIYSSSCISNPCVIGLRKPKVYIPKQMLEIAEQQQLTHVLIHELAHISRKDYLTNILITTINILHWFNPIIWYVVRQLNLNREIDCDAFALELLGQEESFSYGMTLIHFSRLMPQDRFQSQIPYYYKSKKQIERRIVMINKFKRGSYKLSLYAIVICLMICAPILTNAAGTGFNPAVAAAAVKNNVEQAARTGNSLSDPIKARLGHSDYMYFHNIEKALSYAGFDLKVPSYLPAGYELYGLRLYQKSIDNQNLLIINYWSTTDEGRMVSSNEEHHFSISVSKGNLLKAAKSVKNSTYQQNDTKVAGHDAVILTRQSSNETNQDNKQSDIYTNITIKDTTKALIWQDQGVWYQLEYYVSTEGPDAMVSQLEDMSKNELEKIVDSMKNTKDVKNLDFVTKIFKGSFAVYDEQDFKNAAKLVDFSPILPLKLPGDYILTSANVSRGIYFETDQETPTLHLKFNQANESKVKHDSPSISLDQTKLSSLYDSICKNGYIEVWNVDKQKNDKIPSKTVTLAGIKVFTMEETNTTDYVWSQNGIYYDVSISKEISDKDGIIKVLISELPYQTTN